MRARSLTAFLSCPSRKSHTLVIDFPIMMIKVSFKVLDKHSGALKTFEYKSFDIHDIHNRDIVLRSIGTQLKSWLCTESIFQIETFIEHEVTELSMF